MQFNENFTFNHARKILPYLKDLGISHVYSSPLLKARKGSIHCYDVVDHQKLNPEIGTINDLSRFVSELKKNGLGMILDFVPNHMATDETNRLWWDVLENGKNSKFSNYFDIDWHINRGKLANKVLLPILESSVDQCIRSKQFHLGLKRNQVCLSVSNAVLPISRESVHFIKSLMFGYASKDILNSNSSSKKQKLVISRQSKWSNRQKNEILRSDLGDLIRIDKRTRFSLNRVLDEINESPILMRRFLSLQHYYPIFWQKGLEFLNYRRFFNVNDLVAARQELDSVFEESHSLVAKWFSRGFIQGLRIDHPDGLLDPKKYFQKLNETLTSSHGLKKSRPYVLAEKILTGSERLREDWPVSGTTGYDFLNEANSLFVEPNGRRRLERFYEEFTGSKNSFEDTCFYSKTLILRQYMQSDVRELFRLAKKAMKDSNNMTKPFDNQSLRRAIGLVAASFPVYRSYIERDGEVSFSDKHYWRRAFAYSKGRSSGDEKVNDCIRLIHEIVLTRNDAGARAFIQRLQQLTSAVCAKGLEDTAFYRYIPLVSLNEVGGDPSCFGVDPRDFHRANETRANSWPSSLLSTSTHDTKRSEDVRARVNVLSELANEWVGCLSRWNNFNEQFRASKDVPSRSDEYLFYESLVGILPWQFLREDKQLSLEEDVIERLCEYMQKASREAKLQTNWLIPNKKYETALDEFVKNVLKNEDPTFLKELRQFSSKVADIGAFNSLSQVILKLTCPGVPDIYQGNEVWDYSLVDPDNRRPVDFDARRKVLFELKSITKSERGEARNFEELLQTVGDGRIKLFVIVKLLHLRKRFPRVFLRGDYFPIQAQGSLAGNVISFARVAEGNSHVVLIVVPRFLSQILSYKSNDKLNKQWFGTKLFVPREFFDDGEYLKNLFTGKETRIWAKSRRFVALDLAEVFEDLPFAVLFRSKKRD